VVPLAPAKGCGAMSKRRAPVDHGLSGGETIAVILGIGLLGYGLLSLGTAYVLGQIIPGVVNGLATQNTTPNTNTLSPPSTQ